jgi:iron(III) transport system ATP-binding protein
MTFQSATPPAEKAKNKSIVSIDGLKKYFRREDGSTVPAIDDARLEVEVGEVLVLLGPSGCGKTTLLRAIAGLERPDSGRIEIDGRVVYNSAGGLNLAPEQRTISMIFQSYALWPHMTALKNVSYPLEARKVPTAEARQRAAKALALVGIPELAGQYPSNMSGGQQQRVALARAIVSNDRLVLFDEPLSNVDAKVRQQLRLELLQMQRKLGYSAIYVTHDQIEAMALADRIAVLRSGKIEQIGTPEEVYGRPVTRYVANFIGTTNEVPATLASRIDAGWVRVDTPMGQLTARCDLPSLQPGARLALIFRPERVALSATNPGEGSWRGVLDTVLFLGAYSECIVRVGDQLVSVSSSSQRPGIEGEEIWLTVEPDHLRVVPWDS